MIESTFYLRRGHMMIMMSCVLSTHRSVGLILAVESYTTRITALPNSATFSTIRRSHWQTLHNVITQVDRTESLVAGTGCLLGMLCAANE